MKQKVAVVIVTYGDRYRYVKQVVDRLVGMHNIESILIVNNGNKEKYITDSEKILNINLKENTGSANGYYTGLKEIKTGNFDYVWMLDDDNLPAENSLEILLKDYENAKDKDKVFSSFREDRRELKEKGFQKYVKNSFFGFSLRSKIFKKKEMDYKRDDSLISCETVPYGGLLLHTVDIESIGYPNRDFYLYNDDNDYTYRLTKSGKQIFCDTRSIIRDLESSWYRREKVPMFKAFFHTGLILNGKYTIRNRTCFELHNIVDNKLIYILNIGSYLAFVFIFYMPKNMSGLRKFNIILKMIFLGFVGKLGRL